VTGVYERGGMLKNTSNISGTGNKSTQTGTTSYGKKPVSTISLIFLGATFFVLVVMTIALYQEFKATGENWLQTYVLGMLAIAVFLWLSALLALRFRPRKAKPATHKVLDALITTLKMDSNPDARIAAVRGLSELDLEESAEHMKHSDIDSILISVLQTDPDSRVRTAAAEGLSVVELEKCSYHHTHDRLDDTLLKHGIAD
jgi:HEAT repeats